MKYTNRQIDEWCRENHSFLVWLCQQRKGYCGELTDYDIDEKRNKHRRDVPDDLMSAARMAVHTAHRKFEPGRGATLQSLAFAHFLNAGKAAHKRARRGQVDSSLDAPIGEGDTRTLGDCIPAQSEPNKAERSELTQAVADLLAVLPKRHARLVEMVRMHGFSLSDAATTLGVSRERARQINNQALARLRKAAPSHMRSLLR